jgi:hypothetical protein
LIPKVFDGAPFPLRIVLITAVDERPAAFGFVAAIELGIAKDVEIARMRKIEILLRFIKSS